jgi:hypothetical protein
MIADALREFIESNQYDYADVGNRCFRLRFSGKNGDYNMFAQATEEAGHAAVFTYCPVKMPEDRRGQVADYLNRVNYGLAIGCLEMDSADGQVRSRSSAPVEHGEPGPEVLRPLFDSSFYLVENWLPGLLRVAFGSEDAASAYSSMLEALTSQDGQVEGTDTGEDESDSVSEPEPELTAVEQEVLRLLGDKDCDTESPPPAF